MSRRPRGLTLFIGHPLVGVPSSLACLFVAYAGWQTSNVIVMIFALVALTWIGKAIEQADAYRSWRRAWDAMADAPPRRRFIPARIVGGVIGIVLLAAIVMGQGDALLHYAAMAPVGLMGLLVIIVVTRVGRWLFRRGRRQRSVGLQPVAIIAQPLMPVPSLAEAYRRLPPHCDAILRRQA